MYWSRHVALNTFDNLTVHRDRDERYVHLSTNHEKQQHFIWDFNTFLAGKKLIHGFFPFKIAHMQSYLRMWKLPHALSGAVYKNWKEDTEIKAFSLSSKLLNPNLIGQLNVSKLLRVEFYELRCSYCCSL